MEKELKQINKRLAEIESMCAKLIDLIIGQDIKLDEVTLIIARIYQCRVGLRSSAPTYRETENTEWLY